MSIFFLPLWLNVAAFGMDNGAIRCGKILVSLREHRRADAEAEDGLARALRELHAWRSRELNRFDFEASNRVASGASTASDRTLQKIAARASGVLADANLSRARVWGVRLEPAEIALEIERRAEIGRALSEIYREPVKTQQYGAFLTNGLGLAATAAFAVMTTQLDGAMVTVPALAVPLVMLRHLPENMYRLFQTYHPEGDELKLAAMVADGSVRWAYRAFDVRAPVESVRRILRDGDVGRQDLEEFHRDISYPVETLKMSQKWLALPPGGPPGPIDWVRFDELVIRRESESTVVLTIVRLPAASVAP